MKVLHVMKVFPFPPKDGYRSDIWDRIQSMKRLGYRIHVLVTVRRGETDEAGLKALRAVVDRADVVERAPKLSTLSTLKPTLIASNNTLADFPLDQDYDLTLAECEHTIPIFDNPRLRTGLRVLRVHNNERKYMAELSRADRRLSWKLFFAAESMRYGLLGDGVYRRLGLDAFWFISKEECENFSRRQSSLKAAPMWLPPAVTVGLRPEHGGASSKRVLFVGGLGNPLNREGVRWYLSAVHPLLLNDPDYEFAIAGSAGGSEPAHELAQEAAAAPRCQVHLDLDDLGPMYQSSALLINPMRQGSGVKMKTIHAIQQGLPLVTTSTGAEGSGFIDHEHIRVADAPADFAAAVTELLNDPALRDSMAARAFRHLTAHYNSDENIERLLNSLTGSPATARLAVG